LFFPKRTLNGITEANNYLSPEPVEARFRVNLTTNRDSEASFSIPAISDAVHLEPDVSYSGHMRGDNAVSEDTTGVTASATFLFSFLVGTVCEDFTIEVESSSISGEVGGEYRVVAAANTYPTGDVACWREESRFENRTLKVSNLDEGFATGIVYVELKFLVGEGTTRYGGKLARAGFRVRLKREVTPSQIIKDNGVAVKGSISWHKFCIEEPRLGLNITAMSQNKNIPVNFILTRQERARDLSLQNMDMSMWASLGFWYSLKSSMRNPNGFCLRKNSYDICQEFTWTADNLVLCGFSNGVVAGAYLIGVFTYCDVPDVFFTPAPPPASYTADGKRKDRCDDGVDFVLYATTMASNCTLPLINGVEYSGLIRQGEYARFHLNIPTMCYDINLQTTKYEGWPDLYASTDSDADPGVSGSYSIGMRGRHRNQIKMSNTDPEHPKGTYYAAVHCERGKDLTSF